MYLHGIDSAFERRCLLDILAYFLWDEQVASFFSGRHVPFAKEIYKEILEKMKKEAQLNSVNTEDFGFMDMECQELGTVFFLEKRLEIIEQRFKERLPVRLAEHF